MEDDFCLNGIAPNCIVHTGNNTIWLLLLQQQQQRLCDDAMLWVGK